MPVLDPEGKPIGYVEDLILDSAGSGDCVAVLGLRGLEEEWFLVPWEVMHFSPEGGSLIVRASRERIEQGPRLDRSQPLPENERVWRERIRSYYGFQPELALRRESFPPPRAFPPTRTSRSRVFPILIIVTVLVAAALAYTVYTQGWSSTAGSVREATAAVKEASENAATTARVKAALALSSRVSAFSVSVDTDNGVVTLRGRVPSEEVKSLAGAIASDVSGDKPVRNELVVDAASRPETESEDLGQRVVDLEIRVEVDTALRGDPELTESNIHVGVKGRQVTLEGTVQSETQRRRAEEHARGVERVAGVDNRLRVSNRGS